MKSSVTIAEIEKENLYGKEVDFFRNYYIVLGIYNILKSIGNSTSKDSDWFRALGDYITASELGKVYDKIISPEKRNELANSRYRTPPELGEDDHDDIISYMSKNPLYRKKMWQALIKIFKNRLDDYKKELDNADRKKSIMEIRFDEMKELFSLNDREVHLLIAVFFSQTRAVELGDFDINRYRSAEKIKALARIMGIIDVEAAALLDEKSNIKKFALIDEDCDLDRTFLSYLCGITSTPLAERFWRKYDGEVLPWQFFGKIAEKHGSVVKNMINAKKPDSGLAILLYGVPGSGKTSFAASLAADMGKNLYFIAQNDNGSSRMSYSPAFRYAALAVAQKQLPEDAILVIDECDKLVENTGVSGSFLARIFGGDIAGSRDGESKGQLNNVLDNNHHTILFICNSRQEAIDASSRRRFDYNIFWDELSSSSRTFIWKNALKTYNCEDKLDDFFIKKVSERYHVNPGGIAVAVKNAAAICAENPEMDFSREVMVFLKAHCSLLGIQKSPEDLNEPARDYSLDGLNIRSGIKLPRLIQACRNFLRSSSDFTVNRDRPRMNILLFGVPGSGKTEFCKYLCKELDKKLLVKNASDLLNKYVGGTEQRISDAFVEAELENAVLFIDEADSMLSSRDNAVRNFEVSQVNTLLTEMEKFRGIFICSTNLVQRLDAASMRRFNFRLHFDYLVNEGKETFFNTYFTKPMNLPLLSEDEKKKLFAIEQLTPSDFRNVRQQFFYLEDDNLSNAEIIEALETEIIGKNSGSTCKGLGNVVHKMGF